MNYARFYVGDYLRDTARLSMLEHGAYMLMLAHYYAEELPLSVDKDETYAVVRAMTPADRKAVDKVLDRYFTLEADGYHNARADKEIATSKQARDNGGSGGRPRKSKTGSETGNITGSITGSETGIGTGKGGDEGGGSGQPPAASRQPPAFYPPAAAASHQATTEHELSTATSPQRESAAAALWIFPEKLTHAERNDAAKRLNGHPKGQVFLDELCGVMASKAVRNPVGLLDSFIKADGKGAFSASHAYRIQVEREGQQVKTEVASSRAA